MVQVEREEFFDAKTNERKQTYVLMILFVNSDFSKINWYITLGANAHLTE